MFHSILTAVVLLATASPDLTAPRLLLLDLGAEGVAPEVATSLTDLLDIEIERGGLFDVVSQQDLRQMLEAEQLRQLLGEDDGSEAALDAIAAAASAPYVLRGSIGHLGSTYVLSLDLIDMSTRAVARRVSQTLVGDAEGLVGALRAAALALNLEEKGVARDLSAELIDGLEIAQKRKRLIIAVMPGYEVPVGAVQDAQSVTYLRPSLAHLRVSAEALFLPWVRLTASAGVASSLGAEHRMQDKHLAFVYDADTGEKLSEKTLVATSSVAYRAIRVPALVGIRLAPPTGRLLPHLGLGVGAAWMHYDLEEEKLGLLHEQDAGGQCAAPYAPDEGYCGLEIAGKPEGSISTLSFELLATAGIEWLATHHLGFRVEIGYGLSYAFERERDLDTVFVSDPVVYEGPGGERRAEVYGDTIPIRRLHHGVLAAAGLIAFF